MSFDPALPHVVLDGAIVVHEHDAERPAASLARGMIWPGSHLLPDDWVPTLVRGTQLEPVSLAPTALAAFAAGLRWAAALTTDPPTRIHATARLLPADLRDHERAVVLGLTRATVTRAIGALATAGRARRSSGRLVIETGGA